MYRNGWAMGIQQQACMQEGLSGPATLLQKICDMNPTGTGRTSGQVQLGREPRGKRTLALSSNDPEKLVFNFTPSAGIQAY